MSLNRLIVLAVGLGVVAVAAPEFAPRLFDAAMLSREQEVDMPAAPLPRPPLERVGEQPEPTRAGGRRVALRADERGHYEVAATVNGRRIGMIVDTGATTVALNEESARRIGIYLNRSDFTVRISTANGPIAAAPVKLREIRLDGISVRNVDAVVLPGEVLGINLLGMTFLSRLSRFESAGGQLVLVQ